MSSLEVFLGLACLARVFWILVCLRTFAGLRVSCFALSLAADSSGVGRRAPKVCHNGTRKQWLEQQLEQTIGAVVGLDKVAAKKRDCGLGAST